MSSSTGFWGRLAATANSLFSGESDEDGESPAAGGRAAVAEESRSGSERAEGGRALDVDFTIAVIALGAKLAKADGVVTDNERAAFERVFRPPTHARAQARRVFALAQTTTLGFESYARRLARRWRAFPAILEDVLDGLFSVAAADGVVTPDELAYLQTVAEIFGLSEREFRRIKASWLGPEADDPYLVLGVDADIADADLKRAYRRVAAANHPDRIRALGLPEAAEQLATAKMAAINAAYQRILRERGLEQPLDD